MRRRIAGSLGLICVAAAIAAGAIYLQGDSDESVETNSASRTAVVPTETVQVTRRDLTEDVGLTGTPNYGDPVVLPIDADGLVTSAPAANDVLGPGDELIRIDNRPITLAKGTTPLYRELLRVGRYDTDEAGDRLGLQEGDDVIQLQQFLIDAGFNDEDRLEVDGIFGLTTERSVKAWQRDVGLPATGKVDRSQLVFVREPVRVDAAPAVGTRFDQVSVGGVKPVVQFNVTSRQRPFFDEGIEVTIESDAGDLAGVVTSVKRTTGADGSTAHAVQVDFVDETVPADTETVKVISTRMRAENVTTVPVRALVALAEGGWAVQVETAAGLELTAVALGEVIDGIAEIEGIDEGTDVVVPT